MTGVELPTTIVGLIGLAIVTVGGIIHQRIQQQIVSRQIRDTAGKVNEMHEQTVNDHRRKSNMRDDLDKTRDATIATHDTTHDIYNAVRDMQERQMAQGRELSGMRADMSGVRADMTGLRTDVTSVSKELHDERQRSIETDASLWRAITRNGEDEPG